MYHGHGNRSKAEHAEDCPVRWYKGFLGAPEEPHCTCEEVNDAD